MIGEDLKRATVLTALNNMVIKGYFDICTVDSCAAILGLTLRGSEEYTLLRALHCINFAAMPIDVRRSIPELVKRCLSMESLPMFTEAPVIDMSPKKSIWNRLLN